MTTTIEPIKPGNPQAGVWTGQPDVIEGTVREFIPTANPWGIQGDYLFSYTPRDIVSAWWSQRCDYELRNMFYSPHNWLMQGAVNLFIQNVLSTPYEISGGRNQTYKWQDIFYEAEFGEGYDYLFSKLLLDVLTLNRGGFIGIAAYGEPDEPLEEGAQILGLYHMDGLRTVMTGNYEFPYIYYSEYTGRLHKLHRTRVLRVVDMPTADTRRYGMGISAFYRGLSIANAQILLGKQQNELLNDMPPPGIVVFSNVKPDNVSQWMQQYSAERTRDAQQTYAPLMRLESVNPNNPAKVEFVPLSQVPQGFNYREFVEIHVNAIALALSIDPQDIWPLTGAPLGSGTQSKILASKARGKGYGYMLKKLERIINGLIPRGLEFKFKYRDEEQGLEMAAIAQTWMAVVTSATGVLTEMEKREILANNVPAFQDVLFDENGNVRLPDDDLKDESEPTPEELAQQAAALVSQNQMTAQSQTPTPSATEATPKEDQVSSGSQTPEENKPKKNAPPVDEAAQKDFLSIRDMLLKFSSTTKDYDATRATFMDAVSVLIEDAPTVNRNTFAIRLRAAINTYGRAAYLDGLNAGGVEVDSLDEDALMDIAGLLADNSGYVSALADSIYHSGAQPDPENRAVLWANKTLAPFYNGGLVSADANGMYRWDLGATEEHCDSCSRMNGQIHRLKDYEARDLIPPTSETKCGGWHCLCNLTRVKGRARGSWL